MFKVFMCYDNGLNPVKVDADSSMFKGDNLVLFNSDQKNKADNFIFPEEVAGFRLHDITHWIRVYDGIDTQEVPKMTEEEFIRAAKNIGFSSFDRSRIQLDENKDLA